MSGDADAMEDEFDTVAAWTAQVVEALDPAERIPAACRGSGSPSALRWLLDRLDAQAGQVFLDSGAGVGGPAAFAAGETGVRAVLTEPQPGACRAARALFGLPVVQAASSLPLAAGSIDCGWSLGVLCTVDDQPLFLREVQRVLRPGARFGLVVYCVTHSGPMRGQAPDGNDFPTLDKLEGMLDDAGLRVLDSGWADDFAAFPPGWEEVTETVQGQLERRHGDDPRWQRSEEQASLMGSLLGSGEVRGRLLVVQAADTA